jgi:hypothetical protein
MTSQGRGHYYRQHTTKENQADAEILAAIGTLSNL